MSSRLDTAIPDPKAPASPEAPVPAGRRRRSIPPVAFGLLVVVVFFGGIGIAYAGGAWQTTGGSMGGSGRPTLQGASSTEVKGWMQVGDVADAFGVPLADVLAAFDLPADTDRTTALKDLESDVFSVPALRAWLAAEGTAAP
jgi:hypothetical protein